MKNGLIQLMMEKSTRQKRVILEHSKNLQNDICFQLRLGSTCASMQSDPSFHYMLYYIQSDTLSITRLIFHVKSRPLNNFPFFFCTYSEKIYVSSTDMYKQNENCMYYVGFQTIFVIPQYAFSHHICVFDC